MDEITAKILPWLLILVTALVSLTFLILYAFMQKRKDKRTDEAVLKNSAYCRKILEVNRKYNFSWDIGQRGTLFFYETKSSKAQYDRCSVDDIFYENIKGFPMLAQRALEDVEKNRRLYLQYNAEISKLHSEATRDDCKRWKVPYDLFLAKERERANILILNPILTVRAVCTKAYSSPARRNTYKYEDAFPEEAIRNCLERIEKERQQQNTEAYRRKQERQRVTDKLRYQILRRDGFRCQICGATQADGVKLHVDHIIPVSKGGTSDAHNLRTLCDRCNLGKGDQIERDWDYI